MASFYPLIYNGTGIEQSYTSSVLNYVNFPVTKSVSASYNTRLPDSYYFYSQSADITTATNTVSASVFEFTVPNTLEQQYYAVDSVIGVQSTAGATGVRMGLQTQNNGDGCFGIKAGSTSLTAFVYRYQGTQDAFAFALPGTTLVANTTYPYNIKGWITNSTSSVGPFRNVVLIQSETNNNVTAESGSVFYPLYAGYSSSLTPVSSSYGSLSLSGSFIKAISGGDLVTQSVLPPLSTDWTSQSLAVNITTGSNVAYQNLFTLTGLTTGTRYLVNFYLIAASPLTTTGVQVRAVTGSFYRGSIYAPSSATALSIQNSADGDNITNLNTGWTVNNAKALIWGEYTLVKTANDPQIQVRSEVSASVVTVFSGSVVYYRAIE